MQACTPSGCIILWYGKEIPNGWNICDGKNGTKDMSNIPVVVHEHYCPAMEFSMSGIIDKDGNQMCHWIQKK